eukprot:7553728-Pyramimonas_sp.AAC.1
MLSCYQSTKKYAAVFRYHIGQLALTAAAKAADGRGPPTALLGAILKHLQLTEPMELIPWCALHPYTPLPPYWALSLRAPYTPTPPYRPTGRYPL